MRQGLRLVAGEGLGPEKEGGAGIGLPVAFFAMRVLRALVYGMSPTDPIAIGGAAALLVGVTLVASYLPARRATRVNPMLALRSE